ncbi:hypothetical protein MZH14_29140, partial [Escherichia coli]|nr:hypothetical protein [Escherichia coli]
ATFRIAFRRHMSLCAPFDWQVAGQTYGGFFYLEMAILDLCKKQVDLILHFDGKYLFWVF